MDEQDFSKAGFNFAAGTAERMNVLLWQVNQHFLLKNYREMYSELVLISQELSPFTHKLEPADGVLKETPESRNALALINSLGEEMKKCQVETEEGDMGFRPSETMVIKFLDLDKYLRALMLKYKLYMITSDETLAAARTTLGWKT